MDIAMHELNSVEINPIFCKGNIFKFLKSGPMWSRKFALLIILIACFCFRIFHSLVDGEIKQQSVGHILHTPWVVKHLEYTHGGS